MKTIHVGIQAVYSELAAAEEPPSFGFGRNSKTDRGVGMFYSERNVLIYFFRLESLDIPPVVAGLWLAIILLGLATMQSRGKQSL